MNTFPIARYQFLFKVLTPIRLPDYAGSALRGAFGQALRRTACMTRLPVCLDCPLRQTCPYTSLFEPCPPEAHPLQKFSQIPVPYIIEPDNWGAKLYQGGEQLRFSMVLIGSAIQQLPLIAYCWQRAFAHEVAHGTAQLLDILHETNNEYQSIYDAKNSKIIPHETGVSINVPETDSVILHIETPLRLQDNGHALAENQVTTRRLLMALVRRVSLLQEFYMGNDVKPDFKLLSADAENVTGIHQLKWFDWTRYSSRQKQKMLLGGVVGKWQLNHLTPEFIRYLALGQWLHVGKNASFGLGRYKITYRI